MWRTERKRKGKKKQTLSDLWDYIKRSYTYRVLENERQNWVNPTFEERMGKIFKCLTDSKNSENPT